MAGEVGVGSGIDRHSLHADTAMEKLMLLKILKILLNMALAILKENYLELNALSLNQIEGI